MMTPREVRRLTRREQTRRYLRRRQVWTPHNGSTFALLDAATQYRHAPRTWYLMWSRACRFQNPHRLPA